MFNGTGSGRITKRNTCASEAKEQARRKRKPTKKANRWEVSSRDFQTSSTPGLKEHTGNQSEDCEPKE
jgi:hypothetical protein